MLLLTAATSLVPFPVVPTPSVGSEENTGEVHYPTTVADTGNVPACGYAGFS